MSKCVNQSELVQILDVSERTLYRWQNEGMPVKMRGANGLSNQYDSRAVIDWMIQREINRRVINGEDGQCFDLDAERARLTYHQANIASLDEQVKEGRLIPTEIVKTAWADLVMAFRSKILSIPTKAAHHFLNLCELTQIQACLKYHLYEALNELAAYDPEHDGMQRPQITEKSDTE